LMYADHNVMQIAKKKNFFFRFFSDMSEHPS
jgi:hypothetical protein